MSHIPSREVYERQPGENSGAFHAFAIYRDLGPKRSLSEASRILDLQQQQQQKTQTRVFFPDSIGSDEDSGSPIPKREGKRKIAGGQIGLLSRKFHWVERAEAWDDHIDQQRRLRYQDEVERMAVKHARNVEAALAAVMQPIAEFLKSLKDEARNADFKQAGSMEMLGAALECIGMLPKLHEAERQAKGVKIRKPGKDDSPQGGSFDWEIKVYQPEREGPDLDVSKLETGSVKGEWEGDTPVKPEVDPAEGQAWG